MLLLMSRMRAWLSRAACQILNLWWGFPVARRFGRPGSGRRAGKLTAASPPDGSSQRAKERRQGGRIPCRRPGASMRFVNDSLRNAFPNMSVRKRTRAERVSAGFGFYNDPAGSERQWTTSQGSSTPQHSSRISSHASSACTHCWQAARPSKRSWMRLPGCTLRSGNSLMLIRSRSRGVADGDREGPLARQTDGHRGP
jgi:hypothetical protein